MLLACIKWNWALEKEKCEIDHNHRVIDRLGKSMACPSDREAMNAKVRQSLKEAETLFNERMDYYFN